MRLRVKIFFVTEKFVYLRCKYININSNFKVMKKILLLGIAACAFAAAHGEYATPGAGTKYSFADIAALTPAVRVVGPHCLAVDSSFTVSAGDILTVDDGDTIKFADRVCVEVEGKALFTPQNRAFFTRTDKAAEPRGLRVGGDEAQCTASNLQIDYIAIAYFGAKYPLQITDCDFAYTLASANSSGSIALSGSCTAPSLVKRCTFTKTESSGIGSAANIAAAVTVDSCKFDDCNTQNTNKPMINLTTPGDAGETFITNNTILGAQRTMVGGIAVNNMVSLPVAHVVVKGNDVRNCRYGITSLGQINFDIIANTLIDNRYESNPMNGGSGISLMSPMATLKLNSRIEGNYIEGSLWGITLIGAGSFCNMGHLEPADQADFNPGGNVFKDNGNNGTTYDKTTPYDLYNNSPNECWAQGNVWSVPQQTEALIETVIFHKADDNSLGEVIFWPAGDASVTDITAETPDGPCTYFNLQGQPVSNPLPGQLLLKRQGTKTQKTYITK